MTVITLMRTLETRKYASHVQFGTVRHLWSTFSSMYHALNHRQGMAVMAKHVKKTYMTNCPTYGLWFECFMHGMHMQMSKVVKPNLAISIEVMLALVEDLEVDWKDASFFDAKDHVATLAIFCICSFCLALQGEEVPLMVLNGLMEYFDEARAHCLPHVMIPLL